MQLELLTSSSAVNISGIEGQQACVTGEDNHLTSTLRPPHPAPTVPLLLLVMILVQSFEMAWGLYIDRISAKNNG